MEQLRRLRLRTGGFQFQYGDWLLLCFLLGILGGTAAALLFGDGLVRAELAAGTERRMAGREELFLRVFARRAAAMGTGWMAGLTVCSRVLFGALTCYGAMVPAASLTLLTIRKGYLGLPAFLSRWLPQGILYLLVWYVLAGWAGQRERRLRIPAVLLLLAATGMGAGLETLMAVLGLMWG